ncbi:DUF2569 domain-containing protein [Mangrovibacter yixingensis]|uniref:DUF2569 domain-containing protein n=1 Tax=Mangrovibacter yixingensis TaxID=1529639 RepID=UPI001CFC33B9|nr:DUF2569 domain-containing protein [Mangrovibacter yixingensis]
MNNAGALRIGGWLLLPLAWLLMTLLSTSLGIVMYIMALSIPETHTALAAQLPQTAAMWYLSLVFTVAMWFYSLWLVIAFFKRRSKVPRHYILWLLVCVLLAVKAFAFSPVTDAIAVRQLLFPLLAAAVFAPYFRKSQRVKHTFVNT